MLEIKKKISNYNHYDYNNPKYIIIHYTGNKGDTAKNNVDYFYGGNRGASAHLFVDDNECWQSVEFNKGAWHIGNSNTAPNNHNSIGIEMCCNGQGVVTERTESNTIEIVKWLMSDYNIPIENVRTHAEVTSYGKICPNWQNNNWQRWKDFKGKLHNATTPSTNGEWIKQDGKWWYKHSDGSYTKQDFEYIDGNWYYFDYQGYMVTGWLYLTSTGFNYRFDSNGHMYHDCVEDGYKYDSNGHATKL